MRLFWVFVTVTSCQCLQAQLVTCPEKPKKLEICIDLETPVKPLDLDLKSNETLTIKVVGKTPWQIVSTKGDLSAIPSVTEAEQKAVFDILIGFLGVFPVPITYPKEKNSAGAFIISMAKPNEAFRIDQLQSPPEPFLTSYRQLSDRQLKVKTRADSTVVVIEKIKAAYKEAKAMKFEKPTTLVEATKSFTEALGKVKNAIKELDELIKKDKAESEEPLTPTVTASILKQLQLMMQGPIFEKLLPEQQANLIGLTADAVQTQERMEAALVDLNKLLDAMPALKEVIQSVDEDSDNWFQKEEKPFGPRVNQKANIKISAADLISSDPKEKEVATFTATWRKPARISASLGLALSALPKNEFSLAISPPAATPTYKLAETQVRPAIFPVLLLHLKMPGKGLDWALTGGGGADVSGKSPTGEFVAGGSVRFGSLYISPLAHWGRRPSLQTGFAVGDSAPSGFAPPVKTSGDSILQ